MIRHMLTTDTPLAKLKAIIDAVDYITVILASVSVASDTFGFRFVFVFTQISLNE